MTKTSFEDKVVLVTGAGSGIGRASALAFARAGAKVAVVDVGADAGAQTLDLIHNENGEALFFRADITDASAVEDCVKQIVTRWGRLDIAHNNAGISSRQSLTADTLEADFDRVLAVNLKGVWLCMKYEIAQMLQQGGGIIVNTGSALSLRVLPGSVAYNASKHAVAGLTKTAAVEYAKQNIRINAVCPGVIHTPLLDNTPGSDQIMDKLIAVHPIGRLGHVDEVTGAVLWLASESASFVTGTLLSVDGGWGAQ
jgi:NAD(P)-dependent dehydrogenase (short-subunit alcohol dehydrogenase family)